MVEARFRVRSFEEYPDQEAVRVTLFAAGVDGGNTDWSKWTPSGEISMYINNPRAIEWFKSMGSKIVGITFYNPEN